MVDELRPASLTHHSHVSHEDCGRSAQKLEEQEDVNVGRERRAQTAHQQEAGGEQDGQAAAVPWDTAEDSVCYSQSHHVKDRNAQRHSISIRLVAVEKMFLLGGARGDHGSL